MAMVARAKPNDRTRESISETLYFPKINVAGLEELLVAFSEMDVVFNFITLFITSDYYKNLIILIYA
jgi:hypothetical protein